MLYTIDDIIIWGKICQPLAAVGEAKKKTFFNDETADLDLHIKIYDAVQSLDWENEQDPSSDYLFALGNYVIALCGQYLLEAQQISIQGGFSAIATTPSGLASKFYLIRRADFSNATQTTNAAWSGKNISVFANWANRYLDVSEYSLGLGGVLSILISGFDSTSFPDGIIILRVDVE